MSDKDELFALLGADVLGSRLVHNLHRHGVHTQEELRALGDSDLLQWRNVGVSALNRIHERMDHCELWARTPKKQAHREAYQLSLHRQSTLSWFAVLGRDATGTRLANILYRNHYITEDEVRRLTDDDLTDLRGLGVVAMDRLHERIDHCAEWASKRPV